VDVFGWSGQRTGADNGGNIVVNGVFIDVVIVNGILFDVVRVMLEGVIIRLGVVKCVRTKWWSLCLIVVVVLFLLG
jgi:hypothetical protein